MMNQLRELARRYVAGEINYAAFRQELVAVFQPASDNDALVEQLYDIFESGCSAFAHGILDEAGLKNLLSKSATQPQMSFAVNGAILIDVVTQHPYSVAMPEWPSSGLGAYDFSGASNLDDFELEVA